MNTLSIGQRTPLTNINPQAAFVCDFDVTCNNEVDIACFALNANNQLINDDYMIFYNQPISPCRGVKLDMNENQANKLTTKFSIDLSLLSPQVQQLYFVLSSEIALNSLEYLNFNLIQNQTSAYSYHYTASDFGQTKASMLIQIYKKDNTWRISNVAQGFNGGLADIVKHFGGVVSDEAPTIAPAITPTITPATSPKLSLEKIMEKEAPKLVNLAKKASISLEKKQLTGVRARVALVLDASGSMYNQYKGGYVQEVVDRVLPLAVNFDDDKEIECWAFGEKPQFLGAIGLGNYEGFIKSSHGGWQRWDLGSRTNNEKRAIETICNYYSAQDSTIPVYVIFISDGGVHDNRGIERCIKESVKLPIFWQFIGLGGYDYGILEKLDELKGRLIDNCNFFSLDHLHDITEEELYDLMLQEFPMYLKEAKRIGLI